MERQVCKLGEIKITYQFSVVTVETYFTFHTNVYLENVTVIHIQLNSHHPLINGRSQSMHPFRVVPWQLGQNVLSSWKVRAI